MSEYIVLSVARFKDIVAGLARQTSRRSEELARDVDELNKLRDGYQRYRELAAQVESKERSVKLGYALLLNVPVRENPNGDSYADLDRIEEEGESLGIAMSEKDLDLSAFSLWRVIREVVRQTTKIRVFELEDHLKHFGLKASRPAIESALATHPNEFRIIKRGREKYVSLKGA